MRWRGRGLQCQRARYRFLRLPKVLESGRRQLGVAHGVLDVPVPEIGLQRPRIDAVIGELEAAGVAQHVRMHLELEPGGSQRRARAVTEKVLCLRLPALLAPPLAARHPLHTTQFQHYLQRQRF